MKQPLMFKDNINFTKYTLTMRHYLFTCTGFQCFIKFANNFKNNEVQQSRQYCKHYFIFVRVIFARFARASSSRCDPTLKRLWYFLSTLDCQNLSLQISLSPVNRKIKSSQIKLGLQYLGTLISTPQRKQDLVKLPYFISSPLIFFLFSTKNENISLKIRRKIS